MNKVLLTGSSGFIGSELLKILSHRFEVVTLGRKKCDINVDLGFEVPILADRFKTIYHLAGMAHSLQSCSFSEYYKVNVTGTINLLNGLKNSYIPLEFVFISSVSVYGKTTGQNIKESEPLLANDSYGVSKILAERLVEEWCKIYNVKLTILRLPLVVGNNSPGNLRDFIKSIKRGYYFNIAGGNSRKSMVLLDDVTRVIGTAAQIGGIYNLTDGYHPSFSELSYIISQQLRTGKPKNMPLFIAYILAKLGDIFGNKFPLNTNKLIKMTSDLTFDDTKARHSLGWNPKHVLQNFRINIGD